MRAFEHFYITSELPFGKMIKMFIPNSCLSYFAGRIGYAGLIVLYKNFSSPEVLKLEVKIIQVR